MAQRGIVYIIMASMIGWAGCHSSQNSAQPDHPAPVVKPPAAVVNNVTLVDAVIDKKDLIDSVHYSLTIFVVSASPVSGKMSLIEPQQKVTVTAKYFMDAAGGIDLSNERNKKLYALRSKNVGQSIKGTISRDQWGGYNLLTTETE